MWEEDIRDPIVNDEVFEYLTQLKTMLDDAEDGNDQFIAASAEIQSFIDKMPTYTVADYKEFYTQQESLIIALSDIGFSMSCYYDRAKMLTIASDRCKLGTNSIEDIFDQAVDEFDMKRESCLTEVSETTTPQISRR